MSLRKKSNIFKSLKTRWRGSGWFKTVSLKSWPEPLPWVICVTFSGSWDSQWC